MKINPELGAEKLDGYLLAVSSLKSDGTFFHVFHVGEETPEQSLVALCNLLSVSVEGCRLSPSGPATMCGAPTLLKDWMLTRRMILIPEDEPEVDIRMFDGFMEELIDMLGRPNQWLTLRRSAHADPVGQLGAISDVLIFGVVSGSYAIHCSWDS